MLDLFSFLDEAKNSIKIINPNSESLNERGVFNAGLYCAKAKRNKGAIKMKKIDSIKEFAEVFASNHQMSQKDSELILKVQSSLKEHVLNRICTYCGKKVDSKLFKSESEIHDYHNNGMCKKCIKLMLLEPNEDLKWLN